MTTRRSALSYLTGGAVAVGTLVAGGGLIRSCAPKVENITRFDLTDMQHGEARAYTFNTFAQIVVRQDDALVVWDAICPISPGWVLSAPSDGLMWCQHCTNRFTFAGQITRRDGTPRSDLPNLNAGTIATDGLALLIADTQSIPMLSWSSI